MTRQAAIRLTLNILRPFAEAGGIYDDYKADEGFSDNDYEAMLAVLHQDDPASKMGPWSVFYEAEGDINRIGPFDTQDDARKAATKAHADAEFDISDQQVYLVGPDHRMMVLLEDDVGASPVTAADRPVSGRLYPHERKEIHMRKINIEVEAIVSLPVRVKLGLLFVPTTTPTWKPLSSSSLKAIGK